MTNCSRGCTLTDLDPDNCGACDVHCGAGETCSRGKCGEECPVGQTLCAGTCTITVSDADNCGTCGVKCAPKQACVAGTCTYDCPPGQTLCSDSNGARCTDTANDTANCGVCGHPCGTYHALPVCLGGTCRLTTCDAGFADCDGAASDGCEVDLASDANNCGRCGHGCCGGSCVAGVCQPVKLASTVSAPSVVAVDSTDLYWGDGYWLMKCSKAGCQSPQTFASSPYYPTSIAQDTKTIYWTTVEGNIMDCPKSGCKQVPTSFYTGPARSVVLSGASLLWTDGALNGKLLSCSTAGCTAPTSIVVNQTYPRFVAANSMYAFWDNVDTICQCSKAGSCDSNNALVLAKGQTPQNLLADSTSVYWTNVSDGAVRSCVIGACGDTTADLATGQGFGLVITADATSLFWFSPVLGNIYTCAKTGCGGAPSLLASTPWAYSIATDDACIYWTGDNSLMAVAKP